jgi:hypothetical protein
MDKPKFNCSFCKKNNEDVPVVIYPTNNINILKVVCYRCRNYIMDISKDFYLANYNLDTIEGKIKPPLIPDECDHCGKPGERLVFVSKIGFRMVCLQCEPYPTIPIDTRIDLSKFKAKFNDNN